MHVNESYPKAKATCVFNYNSLANYIRLNESKYVYLDESKIVTKPTKELEDKLLSFYENEFKSSAYISENLEKCTMFQNEYPVNGGIYGNVIFSAVVDFAVMSIKEFINKVSRVANLFGYNYVNSDILTANAQMTSSNGTICNCGSMFVQFEASYVDGTSLIVGNSIYHVTTKNAVRKILSQRKGLLPNSTSEHDFSYPNRVYCFVNLPNNLHVKYASNSSKVNRKFISNEDLKKCATNMYDLLCKKASGKVFNTHEFSLLKIDTSKLKDVIFYRDNMFELSGNFVAIYTMQGIPPDAIVKVLDFMV